MDGGNALQIEERAFGELWRSTLRHIPSLYGRLVYLAGLRNSQTGRYEHFGLATYGAENQVHRVLRRQHETLFQSWVSASLQDKMADLQLYIASIRQVNTHELIDAWLRLTPYKNLVPASIQGPERSKHVSDFEVMLELLKNVYGVASPDPTA